MNKQNAVSDLHCQVVACTMIPYNEEHAERMNANFGPKPVEARPTTALRHCKRMVLLHLLLALYQATQHYNALCSGYAFMLQMLGS